MDVTTKYIVKIKYGYSRIKPYSDVLIDWLNQHDRKRILGYIFCVIFVTCLSQKLRLRTYDREMTLRQEASALKPYLMPPPARNFRDFPCYPGLKPSPALKREGKCVRTLDRLNFRISATLGESCKYLQFGEKTPICSFRSVENDKSELYTEEGLDEKKYIEDMLKVLKHNPKMVFLDIGTRKGLYCITAAKVNNRTVCVDSNYKYLQQIQRALFLGGIGLWKNAMVIWNKLTNKHGVEKIRVPAIDVDINLDDEVREFRTHYNQRAESVVVPTLKLNDLQKLYRGKQVFIKIDIGSNEGKLLDGAKQFFTAVDVRIVQMATKDVDSLLESAEFFRNLYFSPFIDPFRNKSLRIDVNVNTLPRYVYFIKDQLFSVLKR